MKTIISMTIFTLCWINMVAQAPQAINYQAVARNSSGEVLANRSLSFRISILSGSETGTAVYTETHTGKTTNQFGLVNLAIGKGTPVTGNLNSVSWESGTYYLKVEMDPAGGSSYQVLGTSHLLSVPYALHSKTVELEADGDPTNEIQELQLSGTVLGLTKSSKTVTLPSSGGGDNWGTQSVVVDATLSGNGTSATPLKIAQQSAANGQVLKWDGSTWKPEKDQQGGLTLPYTGSIATSEAAFKITNTTTNEDVMGCGIYGISAKPGGIGIFGSSTASAFEGYGVRGESDSNSGIGVYGLANSATGLNYGVWGESKGSGGAGIIGRAVSTTGTNYGVIGQALSGSGYSGYFSDGKFYIKGNTGIGTLNPTAKLEIAGRVKITGDCLQINQGTSSRLQIYNSSTGETTLDGLMLSNQNDAAFVWNYENTELNFGTNNTNCMSIKSNGNIGIGTGAPSGKVEIAANTSHLVLYDSNASGDRPGIQFKNNDTQYLCGDDGSNELFGIYSEFSNSRTNDAKLAVFGKANSWGTYIGMTHNGTIGIINTDVGHLTLMPNSGRVGIGTDSPTQALHVVGDAYKTAGGSTWAASSDLRLKTVTGYYSKGLDEIKALQPVTFVYKSDNPRKLDSTREQVGFVAQEVRKIFPDAVTEAADGYLDFNMHEINVALVNAVKELKAENDRLKEENEKLKANGLQVENRLEKLEYMISVYAEKK